MDDHFSKSVLVSMLPCDLQSRLSSFGPSDICECHGIPMSQLEGEHIIRSHVDGTTISGPWIQGICQNNCAWSDPRRGLYYRGGWKDFRFEGHGVFSWQDGSFINGCFVQDCPQTGLQATSGGKHAFPVSYDTGNISVFNPRIKKDPRPLVSPQGPKRVSPVSRTSTGGEQKHISYKIIGSTDQAEAERYSTAASANMSPIAGVGTAEDDSNKACLCCGVKKGKLQGLHRVPLADGSMYIGQWYNGVPEGDGRWHHPDHGTLEGNWRGGLLHGTALAVFPDGGDVLEGSFEASCPLGWCTLRKVSGDVMRVRFDGQRTVFDKHLSPTEMTRVTRPAAVAPATSAQSIDPNKANTRSGDPGSPQATSAAPQLQEQVKVCALTCSAL